MSAQQKPVRIKINGLSLEVNTAITVAAALANDYKTTWRQSPSGQARAPFCGMGLCFECRIKINGVVQRSCQLLVAEGMEIECDV